MEETLAPYAALIRSFLNREISSSQFERLFLHKFKTDKTSRPRDVFLVLDGLFAAADAYVADPVLRDAEDLDDSGLRAAAEEAWRRLSELGVL